MEKRFVLFIVLSLATLTGYALVKSLLMPEKPVVVRQDGDATDEPFATSDEPSLDSPNSDPDPESGETEPATPATATLPGDETPVAPATATDTRPSLDNGGRADTSAVARAESPDQWISLGTYQPGNGPAPGELATATSPPILVTLNARGGSVERIELTERDSNGTLRYRELLERSGYLGHLACTEDAVGGCRVNVVGQGTPAAMATDPREPGAPGLQIGDVIHHVDGVAIMTPGDLTAFLKTTEPEQPIRLDVHRPSGESMTQVQLHATLGVHPLQLIQPERPFNTNETVPLHPPSFLLSLLQVDSDKAPKGTDELTLDRSLRDDNWRVQATSDGRGVEFHMLVTTAGKDGQPIQLEVVKRYRLGRPHGDAGETPYHLDYDIEIKNLSEQPHQIAYRQDGPNGLPLEGFWYSNKLHPTMFYVAGARDIVWKKEARNVSADRSEVIRTFDHELVSCSELHKTATKAAKSNGKSAETVLFDINEDNGGVPMPLYVAVDTQYFVAAMRPVGDQQAIYNAVSAYVVGNLGDIPNAGKKSTNVSFHLDSETITLPAFDPNQTEAGGAFKQSFEVYAGPKVPELLAHYELEDCIYYGWFSTVSKLLAVVLHFFYALVKNYGLAIIMLTVLVRSGMFPLSRKAAKNAAMMQALAPQMKKITEKYKEDMEKRAKAQQELFKKHNYNPFGGCWMMFLQLPIFIGLYRSLSVDIQLRQAALIPGITWCSNLAGPDMLFPWPATFSWTMFTELGMLGPYFNILPMFTVALFLVQQKLFTPPPTDDQSRMQLTMMKYMTVFIGVMFFKVAAGLCLYFIASSLWGIAERKLLPTPKLAGDGGDEAEPLTAKPKPKRPNPKLPDNGRSGRPQPPRSKKKRR